MLLIAELQVEILELTKLVIALPELAAVGNHLIHLLLKWKYPQHDLSVTYGISLVLTRKDPWWRHAPWRF